MGADVLDPSVHRPSAAMAFTMQDNKVLVYQRKGFKYTEFNLKNSNKCKYNLIFGEIDLVLQGLIYI